MEDDKDKLYEMNIEKAKALFEYEMTSVLQAVSEEDCEAGKELINRYMEMEIDKPELAYNAPDLETEKPDIKLETGVKEMPGFVIPEVKTEIGSLPEIEEGGSFAAPEPVQISGIRESVKESLPETEDFGEIKPVGLPAAEIAADIEKPEINMNPIPETKAFKNPIQPAEFPDIMPLFRVPEYDDRPLFFSNPVPGEPELRIPPAEIDEKALDAKAGFSFELPEVEKAANPVKQAEIPEVPELIIKGGTAVSVSLDEEVRAPDIDTGAFVIPAVKKPEVSVSYKEAEPVRFTDFKPEETVTDAPAYPEIPDAPDITGDIEEILELVRAEI